MTEPTPAELSERLAAFLVAHDVRAADVIVDRLLERLPASPLDRG